MSSETETRPAAAPPTASDLARLPAGASPSSSFSGKNQPRRILPEEAYQSTLSSIVERDYYPSLPSLRRDIAVLERRAAGDVAGAVAVRRAARRLADHEEALAREEAEEEAEAQVERRRRRRRPLHRETVTGFHDRVTSEDNEEFERNMRAEAAERRGRIDRIYCSRADGRDPNSAPTKAITGGEEDGADAATGRSAVGETPLLASDQFTARACRVVAPGCTEEGGSKSDRSALFFAPHHAPASTSATAGGNGGGGTLLENRSAVDGGGDDDKTQLLMPPPPSIGAEKRSRSNGSSSKSSTALMDPSDRNGSGPGGGGGGDDNDDAKLANMRLVEYIPKPSETSREPRIVPECTRFPSQGESRLPPASASRLVGGGIANHRIRAPLDGAETSGTDGDTDLDATPLPLAAERSARAEVQLGKGREVVAMTPLIVPGGTGGVGRRGEGTGTGHGGDDDDANASPIVTWGSVAATPLVVGGAAAAAGVSHLGDMRGQLGEIMAGEVGSGSGGRGATYAVPEANIRERAARAAEERVSDKARKYRSAGTARVAGVAADVTVARHCATPSSAPRCKTPSSSFSKKRRRSSPSFAPESILDRAASLTPAARALLARTSSKSSSLGRSSSNPSSRASARCGSALASALRSSYTPTPSKALSKSSGKMRNSGLRTVAHAATPKVVAGTSAACKKGAPVEKSGSITDGLLNL